MDTSQKYNEAEYFLEMMKDNDENRQRFEYNLSAFLSAARSVTFVLQKESSKNPEFDEWYCKKQMQMKRDKLFKFLKKKRDSGIHKKIIKPRAEISTTIPPVTGATSISVETIVRKADGTIKDYEYSESPVKSKITPKQDNTEITEYKWFFSDCPNEYRTVDVITLCEKYLNDLKLIVEEAESKFGEANAPQKQLTDK